MLRKNTKIAMAMSGGVDSSVSAWLLKKEGYEVTGFFMKFWSDPHCRTDRENACCDDESLKNAKLAAAKINIPFHVIDVKKTFKKIVVDGFIEGYKNLTTPNPCVWCNKFIKFGWFNDFAKTNGFEKIATGHYTQVKKNKKNIFHLLSGLDETKDQSYFLHRLDQDQLSRIVFPVGKMLKSEVFKIAKAQGLMPKNKKESQEICFIAENYVDFLKRNLSSRYFKSGKIVNSDGDLVGKHTGLLGYTIGQRKGILQSGKNENRQVLYVKDVDKKKNELIVGTEPEIFSSQMKIKNISWISDSAKKKAYGGKKLTVKIRYRHTAAPCSMKSDKKKRNEIIVEFKKPQRAIAPGQSCVFYSSQEVLGGGIII